MLSNKSKLTTIFLMLIIMFTTVDSFAKWSRSMLRVREERGRTISVTIDGKRFHKIGRTVTIPNMLPGRHEIIVYAYNSNGHGYRSNVILYKGFVQLRPGKIYYCSVGMRDMNIEENCCIDDYGHWNQNDNWENWDSKSNAWNNNRKWNDRDDRDDRDSWHDHDRWDNKDKWEDRDRNNDDDKYNYNNNEWSEYGGLLSHGRYNQLIDQIRKTSFEASKLTVVNNVLRNTKLNVNQMIGIIKEFSFESTKLQLAKDNYYKLIDKRNALMINDTFTFQSSKDDFLDYIERQERR